MIAPALAGGGQRRSPRLERRRVGSSLERKAWLPGEPLIDPHAHDLDLVGRERVPFGGHALHRVLAGDALYEFAFIALSRHGYLGLQKRFTRIEREIALG